ncbi:hypothetical protein QRO08_22265 [Paracidovorax citrulli]|uniref:Uncharacterized protein n=2 Tax=Paracidovorax citrulli TaxID=80869 RepID=A1TJK0_PARC0|nr:hypothetical protein [Paracidovorax citrulli]ABM31138.1 conserved hypothetical protein [Paracidovorax citrulli AAC00-1]ATG95718.1 hypothetical protein CQB05_18170 [Paracidovorax citrulli]PVY65322.1 hypothetical protein C8E08_2680 [Paracidovorax citrulli]REG70496.1 hypothetical protein C8E07_3700 [Paracidovorax citrulli]RLJ95048.1 hypothetical protein C8E06_3695 [Paracidovorax citrulli]
MESSNQPIPYAARCERLPPSGTTALVWPFVNVAKGEGPYELFLDTNALARTEWAEQLPAADRVRYSLNPWPALMEQWMSNQKLRESPDPAAWVNDRLAPLASRGFLFRARFAQQQVALLRKNESALRTQFSLIFPYVALMRSLLSQKVPPEEALAKLDALMQADVPRFTGMAMLLALSVLLKGRQSLKLDGDPKPAYSYLESFLSFQPGKKDEADHITLPYLRNRAGDLNLWLSVPMLRQAGYEFIGTPALVTEDKALHRVILRTLPPVLTPNRAMGFGVDSNGLDPEICHRIVMAVGPMVVRGAVTSQEKEERLGRLFAMAGAACARPEETAALDEAWRTWCQPGMHERFVV